MNLFSLAKSFPTEEHALAYWCKVRWPKGVRCLFGARSTALDV